MLCPPLDTVLQGLTLPCLDLGDRMGLTDYIDFLTPDDMAHDIMAGIDAYRRPFVAFKLQVCSVDRADRADEVVCTFFQRFSDNTESWAFGTTLNGLGILYHDSRVRKDDYALLEDRLGRLIAGETVTTAPILSRIATVSVVVVMGNM